VKRAYVKVGDSWIGKPAEYPGSQQCCAIELSSLPATSNSEEDNPIVSGPQ
jgi:hypothetical protein